MTGEPSPLELWGGHECTLWRLGSQYHDQSQIGGHYDRPDDIDRFASLGIKRLRYPILWEQLTANAQAPDRWQRADAALQSLRTHHIEPIIGLVHHGSGPPHTNLLAPDFAAGLASHAQEVAERYPDIRDWTPVNEPLTTARFAALYGHWYPHVRDEKLFWTALLNQVDATRLAMAAIRLSRPDARLIQTEDVGRTFSTPGMRDQARFNNERRWASWDLLIGKLTTGHPLYDRLCGFGFRRRLNEIAEAPCPPDILGINHYLTSDRYLDERTDLYPSEQRGGSDALPYADVAAAHLPEGMPGGIRRAIADTYERYGLPIALTEVHNGCTREEQMRWVDEAWHAALAAQQSGVKIVALCAWSLLGAHDWTSLLTQNRGDYENGVWDTRTPTPRETALAPLLRLLSQNRRPHHPVLGRAGWWTSSQPPITTAAQRRPIVIAGATGTLGRALGRACERRNLDFRLVNRAQLPLGDSAATHALLDELNPWAVINAAGWVNVDAAEAHPSECRASNGVGAAVLAQICADRDIHITLFSSDLVFGGGTRRPYVESDSVGPLNIYGHSKVEAEQHIRQSDLPVLIIRTAAFFSPFDPHNFAMHVLNRLERGVPVHAAPHIISPTCVTDLAQTVLDIIIDGEKGIWHLTNGDAASWHDFAHMIAGACGYPTAPIHLAEPQDLGWLAPRPDFSALASERGSLLPSLDASINRFADIYRQQASR